MKPDGATRLRVIPITPAQANVYVARWHRHHAPVPAGLHWFGVAAVDDDRIVGVAIAGRPTNRNSDDGQTVEVLRVATTGHPNACSVLYGACARAAKAMGAWRVITYTLDDESGGSLRGAGWERVGDGIKSYWLDDKTRTPAVRRDHMTSTKTKWQVTYMDAPAEVVRPDDVATPQDVLGLGA